jgi:hypothetical protein
MPTNLFRLEFLPNEILIDIFQYFNVRDLHRAFYNLNSRFNILLQSCNNLILSLSKSDFNNIDQYEIFIPYIHTLILDFETDIYLNIFTNIRRLQLLSPTNVQFNELQSAILPSLEHLSVGYKRGYSFFQDLIDERNLYEKIFSNGFPHLKTCTLLLENFIFPLSNVNQLTHLRILRIQLISFTTYNSILLLCPNLDLFQFSPQPYKQSIHPAQHTNLSRMIMIFCNLSKPLYDCDIDPYLASVPNLDQLIVHGTNENSNITEYLTYNWLTASINRHLLSLQRFKYNLHVYSAGDLIEQDDNKMLNRLQENFKYEHKNRYQSKLIFKLYPWLIIDE